MNLIVGLEQTYVLFLNIATGDIEARKKSGAKRKASSENEGTSTKEKR